MAQIHASHNDLEEKLKKSKEELEKVWRKDRLKSRKLHDSMRPVLLALGIACILVFVYLIFNARIPREVRLWFAEELVQKTRARLRNSWASNSKTAVGMILGLVLDLIWPLVCLVVPLLMPLLGWLVWILMYAIPLLLGMLLLADALGKHNKAETMPDMKGEDGLYLEMLAFEAGISISDSGILEAGLKGEQSALKYLESLDDDCHIYTNLRVPFEGKESETDMIVVTPAGITIVEVKNYKGVISGDTSDENLVRVKNHRDESEGENTFYNPFRQVGTHAYRLAGYLREHGVRSRVRTGVFFVNEDVTLRLSDRERVLESKCPVFKVQDVSRLCRYLENSGQALSDRDYRRTLELLDALMR